ncbi:beta strand repeat-containing protein [Hephaestia sp. GCM10023244]|uniref:beta strand repeat-containing protein n=1 Tax=unclassified Hephaestia TaxID=2631281 RepID=UPI0020777A07|nr:Calx-beta domain-containing protein [Hephaestia sp. MAHUQ-44]MCM8732009.1 hypothetical protein [Hephaestia sp. MAHUQ-44]
MAILVLDNESNVAAGTVSVFGTSGHEDLTIFAGAKVTLLSGFELGGDTIRFSGNADDYNVVRDGSTVVFTDAAGTSVRLPVSLTGSTEVVFADGTFDVGLDGGQVVIGDQVITTTPAPVEGGSSSGGDGDIFNITVAAVADVVEGAGDLVFRFDRPAGQGEITLNVATVGGTATAGQDYTPVAQQVTFAAGQTTQYVIVKVSNDAIRESTETVVLQVTSADGTTTVATATGNILDSLGAEPPVTPQSFILTTGADTIDGGAGNDRISGVQNTTLPGKLLSSADIIDGGDGIDTLILINAGAGFDNKLDDVDLTNVSNVEAIKTNYDNVTLGAKAAAAGIISVDTSESNGTILDISSAGMTNSLNVKMSDEEADVVITDLAIGGDVINTGVNAVGGGYYGYGTIDAIYFANQVTGISVTIDGNAVGDGVAPDADGNLGVAIQSLDAAGNPVGAITYADDEGLALVTAAGITVNDGDTVIGTFDQVVLGTALDDSVTVSGYANGGDGDDYISGSSGNDWLVGGAGDDYLEGRGGVDHLYGGAGDDYLDGGAGLDVMDGGEGSDTYYFDNGEFVAAEAITDTGTGADDIDTLEVYSSSNLTDAQFANKSGFEALDAWGMTLVTLGANAEAAGINIVELGWGGASGASLDAGAFTTDLTVFGYGNIKTGAGDDHVMVINSTGGARTFDLGDGDDTIAESGDNEIKSADVISGGAGYDTLILGVDAETAAMNGYDGALTRNYSTTNMTGIEAIVLETGFQAVADPAGGDVDGFAQSYNINVSAASVAAGGSLIVDGSALQAGLVTYVGADGTLGTADDVTDDERLVLDGSALGAGQSLVGTGGAGDDILIGGAGNDTLTGGAGDDMLLGGAGNDTLDGGEGSDYYLFNNGEFVAGDTINDSGTGADDVDTVGITSATALTDALFANKSGIEVLEASVTTGAGVEVTLGANAQASGIRTVELLGLEDLDASAFTEGLTVGGAGNITTGSGGDTVNFRGNANATIKTNAGDDVVNLASTATGTLTIELGAGNDIIHGGAVVDAADKLDGGTGYDTLELNGVVGIGLNANFKNFEQIDLLAGKAVDATPGTANSYFLSFVDANVTAGGTLKVDGSALRGDVVTNFGGDGVLGGGDDTVGHEAMLIDASAVTGGSVDITAGAGNDIMWGGARADVLNGGAGDDVIFGGAGDDTIYGGDGDDWIVGGDGADIMYGGAGDDTFAVTLTQFNSERDEVFGGEGTNTLAIDGGGSAAADVADVGFNGRYHDVTNVLLSNGTFNWVAGSYSEDAGVETIEIDTGSVGNISLINFTHDGTTLIGADGNDTFTGSAFADIFYTGEGDNIVNAGAGNDTIHLNDDGAAGLQTINAGDGDDIIYGGNNVDALDVINGGAGNDTLVLGYANDSLMTTSTIDFSVGNLTNVETIQLTSGYDADALAGWHDYDLTFGDLNVGASGVLTVNAGDNGSEDIEYVTIDASAFTAGHALHYVNTGAFGESDISGGAGNDVITTGDSTDTVYGGAGNDTINLGAGADYVEGGLGKDTINLGADEDIDVVVINDGDSTTGAFDVISGFQVDSDAAAGLQGTANDSIDFGSAVLTTTAVSVVDGFLQQGSSIGVDVEAQTTFTAALQMVEQMLNSDTGDNSGVLAFEWHGSTYIGEITDTGTGGVFNAASFTDIVQLAGVTGMSELVLDGGFSATSLGLSA